MSGSAGALTNGLMKCRIMPQVAMLDGDGRLGVNSASRESRVGLQGRGVDVRGRERVNVRGHGSCSRGRTDRPDVAENRDGAAAARQIKIESKTHSPVLQHAKHAKE